MRKITSKVLLIIFALVLALSATACFLPEFPGDGGSGGGGGDNSPATNNYTVTFNEKGEEERQIDRLSAIESVMRANVAINVKNDTSSSSGSGVIVDADVFDEDGAKINSQNEFYILTCYHVVSGGGNITVYLPDENARNFNDPEYDSKYTFTGVIDNKIHNDKAITLVGGDSFTDIAVLKLDVTGSGVSSDKIVEAHLPASDYTHSYGEEVFAIGNPGGTMPMSVSQGIISYLERTMSFDGTELTVMQIDAHATHGSSGGGLYNFYGELIGLVNGGSDVYLTRNAIPFKTIYKQGEDTGFKNIATNLIKNKTATNYGYVDGRWNFGIMVEEFTDGTDSYLKVFSVVEGSNADLAGFLQDDVIVKISYFDGTKNVSQPVTTQNSFAQIISKLRTLYGKGDTFYVTVARHGVGGEFDVTLNFKIEKQFIFCDTGA